MRKKSERKETEPGVVTVARKPPERNLLYGPSPCILRPQSSLGPLNSAVVTTFSDRPAHPAHARRSPPKRQRGCTPCVHRNGLPPGSPCKREAPYPLHLPPAPVLPRRTSAAWPARAASTPEQHPASPHRPTCPQ